MPMTAITFATQIIAIRSTMLDRGVTWFIASDMAAKTMKTKKEVAYALVMFLAWSFIELKFGLSKPNASLVLAVDPTTDPTLLMLLIRAG